MNAAPRTPEQMIDRLVERFACWTGLDFGRGSARAALERYLRGRVGLGDPDALAHYLGGVVTPHHPEAVRLVDAITSCHSWFYRDPDQLEAIASALRAEPARPASIWVAGCATGEDAYSMALVAERAGRRATILGTDINTRALAHAARGAYGSWSIREAPPALELARCADGLYEIPERLRRAVTFARHNLMDPPPGCAGGWDVILCRNVLMYLGRERADEVLARLAASVRPGGHLFLGASDILARAPEPLRFVQIGQRHALWRPPHDAPPAAAAPPPPPLSPPPAPVPAPAAAPALGPAEVIPRAISLLERGATSDALALLLAILEADPLCIEARLLAGVAYHHGGDALAAAYELRGVLLLAPELWPAQMYLGFALAKLDDAHGAARAVRRARALAGTTARLALSPAVAAWLEPWRVDAIAMAQHARR